MSSSVKFLGIVLALIGLWVALNALDGGQPTGDGCGGDHSAGGG